VRRFPPANPVFAHDVGDRLSRLAVLCRHLTRGQAGPLLENSGITVRGYYGLVGGGAEFLLLETEAPQAVNNLLAPMMGVLAWDVHQVVERDLTKELQECGVR